MSVRNEAILEYLTKKLGAAPTLRTCARAVEVATVSGYPAPHQSTSVTLGASRLGVSMWRGREVGFELTLTLNRADEDLVGFLGATAAENLRVAASRERRPPIEHNGSYAPGYPPHLLFSESLSLTPELRGRTRLGDGYVHFLAAVPIDDGELRRYDRSPPELIAELAAAGRVADYPR